MSIHHPLAVGNCLAARSREMIESLSNMKKLEFVNPSCVVLDIVLDSVLDSVRSLTFESKVDCNSLQWIQQLLIKLSALEFVCCVFKQKAIRRRCSCSEGSIFMRFFMRF